MIVDELKNEEEKIKIENENLKNELIKKNIEIEFEKNKFVNLKESMNKILNYENENVIIKNIKNIRIENEKKINDLNEKYNKIKNEILKENKEIINLIKDSIENFNNSNNETKDNLEKLENSINLFANDIEKAEQIMIKPKNGKKFRLNRFCLSNEKFTF